MIETQMKYILFMMPAAGKPKRPALEDNTEIYSTWEMVMEERRHFV